MRMSPTQLTWKHPTKVYCQYGKNIEIEDLSLTTLFKTNISYLGKRKMVWIWALFHKSMGTMVESW